MSGEEEKRRIDEMIVEFEKKLASFLEKSKVFC
jgi:hypothetical protein